MWAVPSTISYTNRCRAGARYDLSRAALKKRAACNGCAAILEDLFGLGQPWFLVRGVVEHVERFKPGAEHVRIARCQSSCLDTKPASD